METLNHFPSLKILGIHIDFPDMCQVLDKIVLWVETGTYCRYIVATQMHGIMEARRNPDFKTILNTANLFVPDGISLILVARWRGFKSLKRVPGPEIFLEGCRLAAERGYKVFFYGDTSETLQKLATRLNEQFPTLKIVGMHSPPFRTLTANEDIQETRMINESGADIVWVGLGLPKQERWMFEHRNKLDAHVLIGVGAAFKFVSGRVKRSPTWIGDHGLEWLWRFCQEPRRVWRRVIIDGPHFLLRAAWETLDLRNTRNGK